MASDFDKDDFYVPPTEGYIRNSLTYGLLPEDKNNSISDIYLNSGYGGSDLEFYLRKSGRVPKRLINFVYKNKKNAIKRIPIIGKFALYVKRNILIKKLPGAWFSVPALDLSGILEFELKQFIWQLYILALGRAPDPVGMDNYKYMLCSGATKEAVIYMICISKEFASRAQIVKLDRYRKAYWLYRLRFTPRRLPIIGWVWAVAAIPRRLFRLEVEERVRYLDRLYQERQRSEVFSAQINSLNGRIDSLSRILN